MIQKLYIQNYALIDLLEINFQKGFTVMTGETGAGKSIIMGALSLILGQRADSRSVKDISKKTVIEGTFDISAYAMSKYFDENDLDYDSSGLCILRRELLPSGKNRAFVNDTPVALGVLKALGEQLIDIHSQHQNLLLGDNHFQLHIIDIWAQNGTLLSRYQGEYKRFRELGVTLDRLTRENEECRKEEDYLRYQYNQLCEANLQEDEQTILEEERETLAHAEEIKAGLYSLSQCLDREETGILPLMQESLSFLRSLQRMYTAAEPLCHRMESIYIEAKEILGELE
ncbi:MAG: AAA family ATPase, partial [Porphyromonadaceae bacterium]|nr:AAA family ATPase [Porphyromonadaceae bacterium]